MWFKDGSESQDQLVLQVERDKFVQLWTRRDICLNIMKYCMNGCHLIQRYVSIWGHTTKDLDSSGTQRGPRWLCKVGGIEAYHALKVSHGVMSHLPWIILSYSLFRWTQDVNIMMVLVTCTLTITYHQNWPNPVFLSPAAMTVCLSNIMTICHSSPMSSGIFCLALWSSLQCMSTV